MTLALRLVVPLFALVIATAACGDSGGGDDNGSAPVDATSTPDPFDNQVLTTLVLTSEDVGGLPSLSTAEGTPTGITLTYASTFGDEHYRIESTVGRFADPIEREKNFDHFRRSIARISRNERNYDLPGADLAYVYRTQDRRSQTPTSAILAFRGPFMVLVSQSSPDGTRRDDAFNEETLDRYARLLMSRLDALLATTEPAATPSPGIVATPAP
jgi:hypothetical protein